MAKNIECVFGSVRLALDPDSITIRKVKEIYQALNEIKKSHNPLIKYPRLVDEEGKEEDYDEWRTRVLINYADQLNKNDGESDEDYDQRLISLALADHELSIAFEFIGRLVKIFNLPEVSLDNFESASAEKVCAFCFDILAVARIQEPDGLFSPFRRSVDFLK